MFICIEGCDAAGKATQSRLLADKLKATLFSFPDYDTPMGHIIKGHLKRYWAAQPEDGQEPEVGDVNLLNAKVFQALQLANRLEHATAIRRHLEQGEHVVADRYSPSGLVYGQADGLDATWLANMQEHLPEPDLYLLLDIAPDTSSTRRPERRDRYEEQSGLMERVTFLYRRLWREQRENQGNMRWVVINGNETIEGVERQIWQAVQRLREYAAA